MTFQPKSAPFYSSRRGWGLALLLVAVGGCAGVKPPAKPKPADAKVKKPAKSEQFGKLTGRGWHIPWYTRDPKNPNGPLIPVLIADAKEGAIINTAKATLQLRDVQARMFRNGIQSADIIAPNVTANQSESVFVGTGGVTVRSITDPPDTVITGDKVTWNMKTKVLVAEGHAHITNRTPDGKTSTAEGNRITFDTALKTSSLE